MKKKIILIVFFLLFVVGLVLLFKKNIADVYLRLFNEIPKIERINDALLEEIKKEVFAPPPLRSQDDYSESFLSDPDVIEWTNSKRKENSLLPLVENKKLDASAAAKVQDMFDRQYFEHVSPSGADVKNLAQNAGYEFIVIGENLALGNFENSKALVDAWMDSPGHRANILNTRYKEIGVAAKQGIFEGKNVWIAVQHFGSPLSFCAQPDKSLLSKVKIKENAISAFKNNLDDLKMQIDSMDNGNTTSLRNKINEYNALVERYNELIGSSKKLINDYNLQVRLFNECAVK